MMQETPISQPHSIDAEVMILAAMVQEPFEVEAIVRRSLSRESFFMPNHGLIFSVLLGMLDSRKPVDFALVKEALKRQGKLEDIGGPEALDQFWSTISPAAAIEHYVRIVKEKEALRRVIASGRRVIELAQGYNTEFSEIRDEIEKVVKLKARHGSRVALVDYLQRCRPSVTRRDGARYLEVAEVSDRLKSLALELNLIMIAPSQLNDRGEVREARSIEHDCDVHLQIVSDEKGSEDDVFLCVEKHRQGRRRMRIPLRFNGEYMTLEERETRAAARNPYTDEDYR
jgi:replicative DNA helicase